MTDADVDEHDDPALLPGTAVERGRGAGARAVARSAPDEVPMLPGEIRPHASPFQYVMIAVVLCVLTAVEVGFYYLEGDIPTALLVGCLLALALAKFVMVASLYMHLSSDKPIFKRFFITGAVGAVTLYTIVLTTLHIWD